MLCESFFSCQLRHGREPVTGFASVVSLFISSRTSQLSLTRRTRRERPKVPNKRRQYLHQPKIHEMSRTIDRLSFGQTPAPDHRRVDEDVLLGRPHIVLRMIQPNIYDVQNNSLYPSLNGVPSNSTSQGAACTGVRGDLSTKFAAFCFAAALFLSFTTPLSRAGF